MLDPEKIDPEADLEGAVRELLAGVTQLITQGTNTASYIRRLETSITRRTAALWATVAAGTVLVLVFGFVALDNRAQLQASERRWCPLLSVLVPQPGDPAPVPGPDGKPSRSQLVVARATALYDAYRCDD